MEKDCKDLTLESMQEKLSNEPQSQTCDNLSLISNTIPTSNTDSNNKNTPINIFRINELVSVKPRTWIGINRPGGDGRIKKIHEDVDDDGNTIITYDVKYLIESGTDREIPAVFVEPLKKLESRNVNIRCKDCNCFTNECICEELNKPIKTREFIDKLLLDEGGNPEIVCSHSARKLEATGKDERRRRRRRRRRKIRKEHNKWLNRYYLCCSFLIEEVSYIIYISYFMQLVTKSEI